MAFDSVPESGLIGSRTDQELLIKTEAAVRILSSMTNCNSDCGLGIQISMQNDQQNGRDGERRTLVPVYPAALESTGILDTVDWSVRFDSRILV